MINGLALYGTARRFYFRWHGLSLPMFTWDEACDLMSKNKQRIITDWREATFDNEEEI